MIFSSSPMDPDFLEFIEGKEKEISQKRDDLKKIKEDEMHLQRHKQQLQAIRSSLEGILGQKERDVRRCRGGLTKMQQNVFDQIFPIVEDIHYQELLVLEFTQKLQLQQISKDVEAICCKINEESKLQCEKPSDILWSWFREMKEYEESYQVNNSFCIKDDDIPDCLFFHPRYREVGATNRVQLTFSTRCKGFCLHLDISRESNKPGEESCMPYKVSSDFAIETLALNANKSLLKGETAHEFVKTIVHPCIDVIR